jgi:hypothetical protein
MWEYQAGLGRADFQLIDWRTEGLLGFVASARSLTAPILKKDGTSGYPQLARAMNQPVSEIRVGVEYSPASCRRVHSAGRLADNSLQSTAQALGRKIRCRS